MDHIEYAYTAGMNEDDLDERLREAETGVLALADGDEAYAVPLAHCYDGDVLYFRLGQTEGSTKRAFLDSTETACYVLYGVEPATDPDDLDSWSIVITGQVDRLPPERRDAFDEATINHEFPPIRVFDESIDEIEIEIWMLSIETITGRITPLE